MSSIVSIVIVNYNRADYLEAAITSVLGQTWTDFELLIWDDGSTDTSVAIAQQYAQTDNRVRVITAPHQGSVKAHQDALGQVTGTYLGWVDSDDILAPTALAETVAVLNGNPEVGMVYTDYLDINAHGNIIGYGRRCSIPYSPHRLLMDLMTFQFRLIRHSIYKQVGSVHLSASDYAYDYDLCLRLSEITQIARVKKPLYYYRQHDHSVSATNRTQQTLYSQKAVNAALQRRGLAAKYYLDVDVATSQFRLCLRQTPRWKSALGAACLGLFSITGITTAIAQAQITPNGVDTSVTTNGNIIDITGGQTTGNNLFHSFQQFGVNAGQTANFQAESNIQNILGRITGGNPSAINGNIQVTGGNNPHLFLMNPAGFVFGNGASINVPGAFTATTANGIKFDNGLFNAEGNNEYGSLTGNPSGFAFTMTQPGSIINAGNLEVGTGQSLNLVGGVVVNTGKLTAPGGQISVTSVPGENFVRLSQQGNILSLELSLDNDQPNTIPIASLPELLTLGGNTGLTENPDGNFSLNTSNSTVNTPPGVTVISGNVDVTTGIGGTVNIIGEQVSLTDASIKAGNNSTVNIEARDGIEINNLTGSVGVGSKVNLTASNDIIIGNNDYNFNLREPQLLPEFREIEGSLNITSSNGEVRVTDTNSTINTNGGDINISGAKLSLGNLNTSNQDTDNSGNVTLSASGDISGKNIFTGNGYGGDGSRDITINSSNGSINLGNLNSGNSDNDGTGGDVVLLAKNDITSGGIFTSGGYGYGSGDITINSANGNIKLGNLDSRTRDNYFEDGNGYGYGTSESSGSGESTITITAKEGSILTGDINSDWLGKIGLNAENNLTTGNIDASLLIRDTSEGSGYGGDFNGGGIEITAREGDITTGDIKSSLLLSQNFNLIDSEPQLNNGAVALTARTNINVGKIDTSTNITGVTGTYQAISGNVNLQTINEQGGSSLIRFHSINTTGTSDIEGTAKGGNVNINTNGLIQGTGNTINTGEFVIINGVTIPLLTGGAVKIQHDGGPNNVPFTVGSSTDNGTLGVINTGSNSIIVSGVFAVLPNDGNAPNTPSNITIFSRNTAPTIKSTNIPFANSGVPGVPFNFILNLNAEDSNTDNPTIVIDRIVAGTLRRGETVLGAGDTLNAGETLTYTPPTNISSGGNVPAFTVIATDGVSSSPSIIVQPPVNNLKDVERSEIQPPLMSFLEMEDNLLGNDEDGEKILRQPELGIDTQSENSALSYELVLDLESELTNAVANQLGVSVPEIKTPADGAKLTQQVEQRTGTKPALIYLNFVPVTSSSNTARAANQTLNKTLDNKAAQDEYELEILLVTSKGEPIRKRVSGATKARVLGEAREFRNQVINRLNIDTDEYLPSSQQLYNWIIAPIEADLQAQGINNLVFISDVGLRTTPIAAFHDGKQFLVEKYSVGLMPSLSLTNTTYTDIKNSQVLAFGIARSTQGQEPLPAVPLELSTLVSKIWPGSLLLDEQATLDNLKLVRRQQPFGIIHMATHADFIQGVDNSYIQLWNDRLRLNQIRELRLNQPQVEMLVLSACRTAVGDEEAEIGFAGLAVLAGVKTSVASLWKVNDVSTAALMKKFYQALKTANIRAEALREAQVAMAQGQIYIKDGKVEGLPGFRNLPLATELLRDGKDIKLSHPHYWAGFTMVGSPW